MSLKLVPPKAGRSPHWRVRGTYLGIIVYRSTKTSDRKIAAKILSKWKEEIERGSYAKKANARVAKAAMTKVEFMAEAPESLVLEELRHLCAGLHRVETRLDDLTTRVGHVEAGLGHVRTQIGRLSAQFSEQSARIGGVESAIAVIKKANHGVT